MALTWREVTSNDAPPFTAGHALCRVRILSLPIDNTLNLKIRNFIFKQQRDVTSSVAGANCLQRTNQEETTSKHTMHTFTTSEKVRQGEGKGGGE